MHVCVVLNFFDRMSLSYGPVVKAYDWLDQSEGLWQAGGEAARQAVQPSGGRGVCSARGRALRITQIHSQIHALYLARRHTPMRKHTHNQTHTLC